MRHMCASIRERRTARNADVETARLPRLSARRAEPRTGRRGTRRSSGCRTATDSPARPFARGLSQRPRASDVVVLAQVPRAPCSWGPRLKTAVPIPVYLAGADLAGSRPDAIGARIVSDTISHGTALQAGGPGVGGSIY
eukprot:scaffold306_cov525-Prasinococcus_capsulatus_cf.AAC.25